MKPQQKSERRSWVRYAADRNASYRVIGGTDDKVFACRLRDISATGLGISSTCSHRPGAILNVYIDDRPGFKRALLVRVRQASAQSDGSWHLGCRLMSELSDEDLEALL